MINLYNEREQTRYEPTEEEFKVLLKSLQPGQKLPSLNEHICPKDYYIQLVYENYLDILLGGCTLKFLVDRFITGQNREYIKHGANYLTSYSGARLEFIVSGIIDAIEHRGLNLHFELDEDENILLHNYKQNYYSEALIEVIESYNCIVVGFKINGTKIECYDYSP